MIFRCVKATISAFQQTLSCLSYHSNPNLTLTLRVQRFEMWSYLVMKRDRREATTRTFSSWFDEWRMELDQLVTVVYPGRGRRVFQSWLEMGGWKVVPSPVMSSDSAHCACVKWTGLISRDWWSPYLKTDLRLKGFIFLYPIHGTFS